MHAEKSRRVFVKVKFLLNVILIIIQANAIILLLYNGRGPSEEKLLQLLLTRRQKDK